MAAITPTIDARVCRECPFCRDPISNSEAKAEAKLMKKVEANDHLAIRDMGVRQYNDRDHGSAFEQFKRQPDWATWTHDWRSMFGEGMPTLTSLMNEEGIDGSTKLTTLMEIGEKDEKKEMHHLEKAAICGHIEARYNLAIRQD
eukprot:scaffold7566_cov106-Skeletonema_dohrnii-CCMP3373.AAC.4